MPIITISYLSIAVAFRKPVYALLALALCACSSLPEGGQVKRETAAQLPRQWSAQPLAAAEKSTLQQNLYGLIESPELQRLVGEATTNNPDLKAAAMRLHAAGLALAETRSLRLPWVDFGLNRTRGKSAYLLENTSADLLPNLGEEAGVEQVYSGGFILNWELDLWRRLADEHTAAEKLYSADRWEFRAAQNALAARVTQAWITLWSLRVLIDIERERLRLLTSLEQAITDAYRAGLGTLEDMAVARASAHAARAVLEQRKEQRRAARRALEIMLGRYPAASIRQSGELPAITLPIAGVPATVLAERPDIQAAFNRLEAFNAQTRAAYKALLPTISLQGSLNRSSEQLGRLLSGHQGWALVADVVQPLFRGGRLVDLAQARSAEARAQIFDYRHTVLQAMEEVENALSLEQSLARQQTWYQRAYEDSESVLADYRQRYTSGLATILELLQVQTRTLEFKMALTEIRAERLNNRMALGLALGLTLSEGNEQ